MNIIIIEDEVITAEDLKSILRELVPEAKEIRIIESVKAGIRYFQKNPTPDLIFSDIQLGDGLSFDIFKQVEIKAPIVFCTAYDEYALTAFETNGIHYILKPFNEDKIAEAVDKFRKLKSSFKVEEDTFQQVLHLLENRKEDKEHSILVYQQDRVIPIKIKNTALFYIRNEITHLLTFEQKTFFVNKTLDEVQQLCGNDFYRANRQYIINRNAVKEVGYVRSRKVSVLLNLPFKEDILVSKEKVTDFLEWLKK